MITHRSLADGQRFSDFLVRQPLGDQFEHLRFAIREGILRWRQICRLADLAN